MRREVLRHHPNLTVDTDLIAAGFDSLSLVAVLLCVEREFGIWVPEKDVTADALKSIRTLAAHVLKYFT